MFIGVYKIEYNFCQLRVMQSSGWLHVRDVRDKSGICSGQGQFSDISGILEIFLEGQGHYYLLVDIFFCTQKCIPSHLKIVYCNIFSNHGGQFNCIFSHLRRENFKIFFNHCGQFKCIFSYLG